MYKGTYASSFKEYEGGYEEKEAMTLFRKQIETNFMYGNEEDDD